MLWRAQVSMAPVCVCRWKVESYWPSRYNYRLQGLAMTVRKSIICDNCGKEGARERRVTRSYGRGRNLLVIEGVPVITCPHCGESYLTADTLHELERIKQRRKDLAATRQVAVAHFG